MKIVIELSEKNYKSVMLTQNRPIGQRLPYGLSKAIKNGTILPKRHGRLIDADALEVSMGNDWKTGNEITNCIKSAPTIIEADKESE